MDACEPVDLFVVEESGKACLCVRVNDLSAAICKAVGPLTQAVSTLALSVEELYDISSKAIPEGEKSRCVRRRDHLLSQIGGWPCFEVVSTQTRTLVIAGSNKNKRKRAKTLALVGALALDDERRAAQIIRNDACILEFVRNVRRTLGCNELDPLSDELERSQLDQESIQTCAEKIQLLPAMERDFPVCASYCLNWLLKGSCHIPNCAYLHADQAPSAHQVCVSTFTIEDDFKRACNEILKELSDQVPERRCFVLDGGNGATTKALGRAQGDVLAPNIDSTVVAALRDLCCTVACTASCALDHAARCGLEFGCVYLDYMWPLDYFRSQALRLKSKTPVNNTRRKRIKEVLDSDLQSLDGFQDIERCLGVGGLAPIISSSGCILGVTLVSPDVEQQQKQLEHMLVKGAISLGHRLERIGQRAVESRKVLTNFYLIGLPPDYLRRRPNGLQGPRNVLCDVGSMSPNLRTCQTRQEATWHAFSQKSSQREWTHHKKGRPSQGPILPRKKPAVRKKSKANRPPRQFSIALRMRRGGKRRKRGNQSL